jgi:SRSO17 transposase
VPRWVVVDHVNIGTAAAASIEDLVECTARVDARVRSVLDGVLAQRRSVGAAVDYVTALASGVKANCWALAESAGHEREGRMQGLLGSYRWDWKRLRERPAAAWIPDVETDPVGPGIAIDETAQLKKGEATAGVAPQHAGCTGTVENCVTTVFCAYVTAGGQAWVDFDVYLPQRWVTDPSRRRGAGIPDELQFATKPQLAMNQLDRLTAAGLPARWAAFDEVYGRSEALRTKTANAGLAYVAIIPCDYQIRMPCGTTIRADQATADAVFERRSCGNGSKGPRYSDRAMIATAVEGQYLLIRRLLSRPDSYTFYLCWAPPDRRASMTYFITIAGRRWPVEETFKTGKDVFGWDQTQTRTWHATCRHTALAALAQLRAAAIRNTLTAAITLPAADPHPTDPATDPATGGHRPPMSKSATPTCRSPSATPPSRPAAPNPAHPTSPRSSCPSPKPPGWPSSPPTTPPG